MFDINILIKALLDLQKNSSVLTPFHTKEITAAEDELSQIRQSTEILYKRHRDFLRKRLKEIAENEVQGNTKLAIKAKEKLSFEHDDPVISVLILISKYQQIQRGINIYKHYRFFIIMRYIELRMIKFSQFNSKSFTVDEDFMKNCNKSELKLLNIISDVINKEGLQELLRGIPLAAEFDVDNRIHNPPLWLVKLLQNDDSYNIAMREHFNVRYSYPNDNDINTQRIVESLLTNEKITENLDLDKKINTNFEVHENALDSETDSHINAGK